MRVHYRIGKTVALALLSVSYAGCSNPFSNDPGRVDAEALADPEVRTFYEARTGQAAWDGKSRKQLVEIIGEAPKHGLKPELFLKAELPEDRGEREAVLTKAALRYASALAQGYSDPEKFGRTYTVPRPKVDVAAGLSKAIDDGKLAEWFDGLAPRTSEYRALSAQFVRYLKLANEMGNGTAIPAGEALKPGDRDERLPAIASALVASGYLERQQAPPRRYDRVLVTAVTNMQREFGLKPDGIIGPDTIKALNEGPGDRARQLAVNLERLRWLDRNPPATRIDVNTGGAFLEYWRDGRLRDRRRVVVGQPDWETPQLGSPIFRLVANPNWTVPRSIQKDELADKGPAYLAENNMVWRDGWIVQLPGPENALGQVKFDMRNDHAIYLHDTPAKALFGLDDRHRSHGCVRVQDALGFAFLLAHDDGILMELQEALTKDEETFVKLRKDVPVRLMYRTAFVEDGQVRMVEDAYGWDDDVAYALGYVRQKPRPKQERVGGDIGP